MSRRRQQSRVPRSFPALVWASRAFRALVGVVILALAVGLFALLEATRTEPGVRDEEDAPALIVQTMTVAAGEVAREWEGFGTARARRSAEVAAEVAGRVVERPERVDPGNLIEAGDVIVRVDRTDFAQRVLVSQRTVAAIESELSGLAVEERRLLEQVELAEEETFAARRDYERTLDARERGAASAAEVDARLAMLRRAERAQTALRQEVEMIPARREGLEARAAAERASLLIATENLRRTDVTSPISGVLQRVDADEGEWVGAAQVVARVVDLRTIEVPLRLPVSARASVRAGDAVALRTDGSVETLWEGVVSRIAPEADAATRTMTVFVEVRQEVEAEEDGPRAAPGARLLVPGQFVVGRVRSGVAGRRVVVPRRAIERERLFVAEPPEHGEGPHRVGVRRVTVLHHTEGRFPGLDPVETQWSVLELGAGLREGEIVILSNLEQLAPGMAVEAAGEARARDGEPGPGGGAS